MPYILLQPVTEVAAIGGGSPAYILAWIGIFLMVALSGVGSAWGNGDRRQCHRRAMKKRDDIFANCMILSAMPGTQGLYGFGAFFILKDHIQPEIS